MNTQINELAKSYNEYAIKNLEMVNKFYKLTIEENQQYILNNSQNLFTQISSNMNYLMNTYNTCIKDRETLNKAYIENMDKLYQNFQKTYRDVCEKTTTFAKESK